MPKSVYLSESENRMIESIIETIKIKNSLGKNSEKTIKNIIKNYDGLIDSILLGCTELPIVIDEEYFLGKKVISSIDEYINHII